jgi:hypothetical protein
MMDGPNYSPRQPKTAGGSEEKKKKEEKEELLGFTLRYYEVISIHDTYPIHLTCMVKIRT